MSKPTEPTLPESDVPESTVRRRMITSFGLFAVAAAVPIGVYEWITHSPKVSSVRKPLRTVLDANAALAKTYFSDTHLVATFPVEEAVKNARVNAYYGLKRP